MGEKLVELSLAGASDESGEGLLNPSGGSFADPMVMLNAGLTAEYTGRIENYLGHPSAGAPDYYAFAFFGNLTAERFPADDTWYEVARTSWASGAGQVYIRAKRVGWTSLVVEYNSYENQIKLYTVAILGEGSPFAFFFGRLTGNMCSGIITDAIESKNYNSGNTEHLHKLFTTITPTYTTSRSAEMDTLLMQEFVPGQFNQAGMDAKLAEFSPNFNFDGIVFDV